MLFYLPQYVPRLRTVMLFFLSQKVPRLRNMLLIYPHVSRLRPKLFNLPQTRSSLNTVPQLKTMFVYLHIYIKAKEISMAMFILGSILGREYKTSYHNICMSFTYCKNKTNHPKSSNSHPWPTANKAIHCLKWEGYTPQKKSQSTLGNQILLECPLTVVDDFGGIGSIGATCNIYNIVKIPESTI